MYTDHVFEAKVSDMFLNLYKKILEVTDDQNVRKRIEAEFSSIKASAEQQLDIADGVNNSILLYSLYTDILTAHQMIADGELDYEELCVMMGKIKCYINISNMYIKRISDYVDEINKILEG